MLGSIIMPYLCLGSSYNSGKIICFVNTMHILCADFLKKDFLHKIAVLQIRRGKRDNSGIIFHITPLKHML